MLKTLFRSLFSVLLLKQASLFIGQEDAITKGPENGYLVIVGGNMSDPAIYQKFLELAGGVGGQNCRYCYCRR